VSVSGGIVSDTIQLVQDEKVVREYHVATWGLLQRTKAYLILTNKRLVFSTYSGKNRDVNEMGIQEVHGVDFEYGGQSLARVVAGLLFILVALVGFLSGPSSATIGLIEEIFYFLIAIGGIVVLSTGLQKKFHFTVKSASFGYPFALEARGLLDFGLGWLRRRKEKPEYGGLFLNLTTNTRTMLHEIGGVIMDIKQTGTTTLKSDSP
jgi:hypothetical protein